MSDIDGKGVPAVYFSKSAHTVRDPNVSKKMLKMRENMLQPSDIRDRTRIFLTQQKTMFPDQLKSVVVGNGDMVRTFQYYAKDSINMWDFGSPECGFKDIVVQNCEKSYVIQTLSSHNNFTTLMVVQPNI